MEIKIFGERNTGSRALTQMLSNNSQSIICPGTMNELSPLTAKAISLFQKIGVSASIREPIIDRVFNGRPLLEQWKHSATHFELDHSVSNTHFIFVVRDPRSWLIGLFRKPYHILVAKPDSILGFSNLRWKVVGRDNLPDPAYLPLEMYAAKLRSYLELMNALEQRGLSYSIVRFEDFVTAQEKVFHALRPALTAPSDEFRGLTESTKDSNKDSNYYAEYYSKELWRSDFPEIESVRLPENASVFEAFGYSK